MVMPVKYNVPLYTVARVLSELHDFTPIYLWGLHFTQQTDHKPLLSLFNEQAERSHHMFNEDAACAKSHRDTEMLTFDL